MRYHLISLLIGHFPRGGSTHLDGERKSKGIVIMKMNFNYSVITRNVQMQIIRFFSVEIADVSRKRVFRIAGAPPRHGATPAGNGLIIERDENHLINPAPLGAS